MAATSISPLAPSQILELPPLEGVRLSSCAAGLKYKNRPDILLVELCAGAQVAGVLTQSRCASAPVEWCRRLLPRGTARVLLVNAGNANAFTGGKGRAAVQHLADSVAKLLGHSAEDVFLASTGVIGEPLATSNIEAVFQELKAGLSENGWTDAARAIMTTDTYPKLAQRSFAFGGQSYTLNGIAKGSGMIAPDMATLLSFIFTDAPFPASVLQKALTHAAEGSFNSITVDGDTSTSDTVLLFSTGATLQDTEAEDLFQTALSEVMQELALSVVRDGEGARKLIEVSVRGAVSDASAKKIAFSIANSPLVKTAVAGEDPNWGRIIMAVGKAGEPAERDLLSVFLGDLCVACAGEPAPSYEESAAKVEMRKEHVCITVDLNLGNGHARVWGCDLTEGYIRINTDYRS